MKKVLAITMVLVVLMAVENAFATAVCDICGRGHAGAKCPEECWEQCSMNSAGERHKYYECPEFKASCEFCGETTQEHNKLTCPDGYLVWNDNLGQFQAAGTQDEGVRNPQYCENCAHYGYHFEAECKTGNVTVPESTTSDTTIRVQCTHKWTQVNEPISEQMRDGDPHYCREGIYTCKTLCSECGWIGNQYTIESKIPHEYSEEGKCVNCGYEREGITEATPSFFQNLQFDNRIYGWIGIGAIVVLAVIWFIKRR